nr:YhbY family RNA-binding protein [Candidatus Acidianus copahuensis]
MNSEKLKRVTVEKSAVRIGKNGISQGIIEEIKRQLKEKRVVKIRIGNKEGNRKEIANKIAEITGSRLIEVRGYTFVLEKESSP